MCLFFRLSNLGWEALGFVNISFVLLFRLPEDLFLGPYLGFEVDSLGKEQIVETFGIELGLRLQRHY